LRGQVTNLQKWKEPEGNPTDFPSSQEPSNYFYTVLANVFILK